MAEYDPNSATTTNMSANVKDFSVRAVSPDQEASKGVTWWDFPDCDKYLGYYKTIPELKSALKVFALRVAGLGYTAQRARTLVVLENLNGWGEDTFQTIIQNLIIQKKVFGDAFAEIVRNEQGALINLKPLYPGNMRVYVDDKGRITHYEQTNQTKSPKKFETYEILHLCNDRIGNEIHGISIIESLKTIIDAKNEALEDTKKIKHRDKALGIAYYDTDDTGKISYSNSQIEKAVNKGEMLGLPKGTVEIVDFPNKAIGERIQWLQYLDNLFYQIVGTPKVLVTSEGYTESGGKAGLIAFEPNEIAEKKEIEAALWNQLAIKVTFIRSPSILAQTQSTESKNTSQTGVQANETSVSATRTE